MIGNEKFVPTRREEQLQVEWFSDRNRVEPRVYEFTKNENCSKVKKMDMWMSSLRDCRVAIK